MNAKAQLILSFFFAIVAGLIWFTFLRPVPTQSDTGTITDKLFKPAGTTTITPVRTDYNTQSFSSPITIPTAEGYVLVIQLDSSHQQVRYFANAIESQKYVINQKIRIDYQMHGIPLLYKKASVLKVELVP